MGALKIYFENLPNLFLKTNNNPNFSISYEENMYFRYKLQNLDTLHDYIKNSGIIKGKKVYVYEYINLYNEALQNKNEYKLIKGSPFLPLIDAAKNLGISKSIISAKLDRGTLYKNKYQF